MDQSSGWWQLSCCGYPRMGKGQQVEEQRTVGSNVVIIGGGIIGLATAIELVLQGAQVTVLSQHFPSAAAHAAAGMLAPQAEGIPPGAMLELCLRSRALYPEWIRKLESLTGRETGYWPCGILAPCYAEAMPAPVRTGEWLAAAAIARRQPGLSPELVGGWWFPEDGQVDNRALMQTLQAAAQILGVCLQEGVTVHQIKHRGDRVTELQTSLGPQSADTYVLAAGAWSGQLLPLPVVPRKGQMLAVQVPAEQGPQPLSHVLFGTGIYIVPRQNGRIVLGATSEGVGFAPHNTPAGIQQLLANAIRLYPALQDFAIAELWWGYRPATPDECPILGASPYQNLVLATGHYRNGILLAPVTAKLIAELVSQHQTDPLLNAFRYDRFGIDTAVTP